ncbi:tryptophan synthase subunit alpha [Candidatus Lokiarchaeum ossiferum]|uniref:tryptophan synthase subunit alpha n=1 Tax=Candidatus Lokiarchaeum ossiferum TaxID=2951803 RepID=UPI00352F9616
MNEILARYQQVKAAQEVAFIPFLVLGDPNPEVFLKLIQTIEPYSDFIELGIPFSDPIADGPTILSANHRALQSGSNYSNCFHLIREVRKLTNKPLILLTYGNILGVEPHRKQTLDKFAQSGINGIIAADIPVEESQELLEEAREVEIDIIFLVTPTTHTERLSNIIGKAQGFLYLVAVKGITGARETILNETTSTIRRIISKLGTDRKIPVFVGFGISKPAHIQEIIQMGADGVIVGSALINQIEKNLDNPIAMFEQIEVFAQQMKNATKALRV